jgi:hypothetical protein
VLGFRKRRKAKGERQGDGSREYFCLSWRHLALFAVKKVFYVDGLYELRIGNRQ